MGISLDYVLWGGSWVLLVGFSVVLWVVASLSVVGAGGGVWDCAGVVGLSAEVAGWSFVEDCGWLSGVGLLFAGVDDAVVEAAVVVAGLASLAVFALLWFGIGFGGWTSEGFSPSLFLRLGSAPAFNRSCSITVPAEYL